MTVKIQLVDRDNNPVKNTRVIVKWRGGGLSDRSTNESGIADLGVQAGTAEYIEVRGKIVVSGLKLEDKINQVSDR